MTSDFHIPMKMRAIAVREIAQARHAAALSGPDFDDVALRDAQILNAAASILDRIAATPAEESGE